MTTPKQIIANQQNALLSTGATTEEGKNIVAQNAIKHGIFTKDLIIAAGDGKESLEDYQELLNNLVISLNPTGQMQYILVEKIAVDCWRLKRVLCYETGCIRQFLDTVIFDHSQPKDDNNFYALRPKNNEDLDKEMRETQDCIDWNNNYIKALQNGEIKFDEPLWKNEEIEVELEDDLLEIIDALKYRILTENEHKLYDNGDFDFATIKKVLQRANFTDQDIANELIKNLQQKNVGHQKDLAVLEQKKRKNTFTEETLKTNTLPRGDYAEKVMRYERSLHKSIMQNLLMLKKLQGIW